MSRSKKFDKVKVVKEIARDRIGTPRPGQWIDKQKPRLQPDPLCFWCYDEGCRHCEDQP